MNKTLIIAEAGVNHNGDFQLAKKLVDVAASAGADFVKFQSFKADKLVTRSAVKADYQKANYSDGDNSQYNMLKKLEMPEQWHYDLIDYCKVKGIKFLSTGFDNESIDFLDSLGSPLFKVPSGELTNKTYLQNIARKGKPMIISTGMATLDEIEAALNICSSEGLSLEQITVLHCNTEYPTPMEDVNLLAMTTMAKQLNVRIGYSDHTLGIEVAIAAVALGAQVIEKHFTLDRNMEGPDHKASLEPAELEQMISSIRNIELAISGSGLKEVGRSEQKNKDIARKSLHFGADLKEGHVLTEADLVALRPGNGISPMESDNLIGKILLSDVTAFDIIDLKQLK